MYTVMISDDGMFSAEYVQPPALSIPLGSSGSTVDVRINEDRTYSAMIGGEWVMITAETTVTAANGNVYRARLGPDGTPIGTMHVPAMQEVMLGMYGGTVTLTQGEDMTWSFGDIKVMSGHEIMSNDRTYTLTQDAEGMWEAEFNPVYQIVALGTQGSITLKQLEDMSWWDDTNAVALDGSYERMSENGNTYSLWYSDGVFTALFEPEMIMIEGTGLVARTREADDMYDVGDSQLPASKMGDVMDGDAMYHVWEQDGALMGARFDAALHGDSDIPAFAIIGDLKQATGGDGTDILPVLSADNEDTVANEDRTMLQLGDNSFSVADLLDSGTAQDMGDNFVANARKEVEKVRGDVEALLGLTDEPPGLSGLLTTAWGRVQTQVDSVFGSGEVDLGSRPGEDNLLDEIDEVLAALSSGPAFADATMEDGKGVFEEAALSEANALKAFDAAESEATVTFGMTGATRYGAISVMERTVATGDLDYDANGGIGNGHGDDTTTTDTVEMEMGLVGAFSYSTIDDVQRVWHVATSGSAYYEGGTRAVSGNGKLYSGDIALEVRFSTELSSHCVSGLVTNLMTDDGDPWTFQYGDVESIVLATATSMTNAAHWTETATASDANAARVTFSPRAGSPLPTSVAGTFQGQLLGKGASDDPTANGTHAHGTWSVGTQTDSGSAAYIAGGFGAERTVEPGTGPRPGEDDGSVHETVVTSNDGLADGATAPNSFKLDGGDLVVTMNRYGRYLEDTASTVVNGNPEGLDRDGDNTVDTDRIVLGTIPSTGDPAGDPTSIPDDTNAQGAAVAADVGTNLWVLDSDPDTAGRQNVTHELRQSLANMVANSQTDRNVNGPHKQVELAVRDIEAARGDLTVLQGLASRNTGLEQAAWEKVQAALLRIFHHVPPKLEGAYDEDDALGLIQQVLDAFDSEKSLELALDRDGRGIFNDVTKADGSAEPSASLIFGRQEVQMKTHGGAMHYTRWGVWRVRTDRYAARDAWTQPSATDTNGNAPGSFAYSQLLPTVWEDQDDPNLPRGSAMFVGGTTAIQGTNFLDADLTATVEWDSSWDGSGSDALGTLSVRFTNFADVDGDPLLNSSDDRFYAIVVENLAIGTNDDNEVIFNSANALGNNATSFTALTGVQGVTANALGGTNSMRGQFVGQDVEGPLGVIGTYEFAADGFAGTNVLRGAFGADRP